MSVPASEIVESVPNGIRYRVASTRTDAAACFAEVDWLASREQAVAFAGKLKAAAGGDYRGISLTLDYAPFQVAPRQWLSHAILTGERMPTARILAALHAEAEILLRLGLEFTAIECQCDDATLMAVNHRYVALYYFTAS